MSDPIDNWLARPVADTPERIQAWRELVVCARQTFDQAAHKSKTRAKWRGMFEYPKKTDK